MRHPLLLTARLEDLPAEDEYEGLSLSSFMAKM
jgi:hypothetical protein